MEVRAIEKFAGYGRDFVGGVDPTGTITLKQGKKHEEENNQHKGLHRAVGIAGGVIGGGAIAGALSGISAQAVGKALTHTKRFKDIGHSVNQVGKDSYGIFNPFRAYKTVKKMPEANDITNRMLNAGSKAINKDKIDVKDMKHLDEAKKLKEDYRNFVKEHGQTPEEVTRKGVGIISGAASAGLGGGLAGYSAYKQYNTGGKIAKEERDIKKGH